MLCSNDFGSFDIGFGSLNAVLGTVFSSFSGLFSLGFFEGSLDVLLCSLESSLKALLCSFESLDGLSLCSFVDLCDLEKLLELLLFGSCEIERGKNSHPFQ